MVHVLERVKLRGKDVPRTLYRLWKENENNEINNDSQFHVANMYVKYVCRVLVFWPIRHYSVSLGISGMARP